MSGKNNSSLDTLLCPQSVAVIGASRHAKKLGHIVLQNLRDGHFPDGIFPVNPEAKSIDGLTCYSTIESLPIVPDLAVIVIPAAFVIPSISTAARFGIKNFVVLSAGFKEIGGDGIARELALESLARTYGLTILGPNCLGFLNATHHINATFGDRNYTVGNLRMISQSGAMATSLFDWAHESHIGLDGVITLGNKAVVDENTILKHWLEHDDHESESPVALYLESISHGEEFVALATKLSLHHPLILLKPGKSEAAQHAVQSHTGAMAQSDAVLETAARLSGIIRADGVEDLFDLIRTTTWMSAPEGANVAIVSNAGGPAVIATDLVEGVGLTLAPMSKTTHNTLLRHLPREANISNPIDVLGDALADRYRTALDATLAEPHVHAVIVILTPQVMTQIEATAAVIATAAKKFRKPIVCSFMGGSHIASGERVLNYYHIPSFRYPERAVRTLGSIVRWNTWRKHTKATANDPLVRPRLSLTAKKHIIHSIRQARRDHRTVLTSLESNHTLKELHLPVPPGTSVDSMVSAMHFANLHGYPLVAKISSSRLMHKSDAHAVVTDIASHESLHRAIRSLEKSIHTLGLAKDPTTQIQLQKQITDGVEVIIGMHRDPQFGPVWLIGAGGIFTELMHDESLALPPFSRARIAEWIGSTKVATILRGYRGADPYALHALTDFIVGLLPLGDIPDIADVTLNPVIVTHDNAIAVDARIILTTPAE